MSGLDLAPDDPQLFDRLIADWVVESMPLGDPRWQAIVARKLQETKRKLWTRRVLSMLGVAKSSKTFRQPEYVKGRYNDIWRGEHWPRPVTAGGPAKLMEITWRGNGYVAARGMVSQPHLDRLMHVISSLKPKRVLEVGCGPGQNLFAIAGVFPAIAFDGLELSEAGVEEARRIQSSPGLPAEALAYCPVPHADPGAFKRIVFTQGSALEMPYADRSFDLVFTRLAIEQMNVIREQVFREIARVAARHVAMIEPFADFATTPLQRLSTMKKNHFDAPVAWIGGFGLSPVAVFSDWPQKLTEGIGLVLAERKV